MHQQSDSQMIDCRVKVGPRLVLPFDHLQVGARLAIDAQVFEVIKLHAFTRKADGTQGTLIDWRSNCPTVSAKTSPHFRKR
ncbi:hypothetical protein [Sphingobium tyrosinilyticum]|uniref:Transposase n=1 Tax=Sphingobium tyrosinilyticum TaxID=2715436 RepID=A0ABV9EXW4_9SPHN